MITPEHVKEAFCGIDAIRSVMLVDDEFPTYSDLQAAQTAGELSKWASDRSKALYDAFKEKRLLCDFENLPENLTDEGFNRVRKSDLIVLDYNLTPDHSDASHSIRLLSDLATSPHFNLVVVYTKEDLEKAWMRVAATLRGGWRKIGELLKSEEELEIIERISGPEAVTPTILANYLLTGRKNLQKCGGDAALGKLLKEHGVPDPRQIWLAEALVHDHANRFLRVTPQNPESAITGRCDPNQPLWIQTGSVFVTFMKKSDQPQEDAATILPALQDALVDWKPNVLRILLSHIENAVELKGLAYDREVFQSEHLQVGWMYHAMHELAQAETDSHPPSSSGEHPPVAPSLPAVETEVETTTEPAAMAVEDAVPPPQVDAPSTTAEASEARSHRHVFRMCVEQLVDRLLDTVRGKLLGEVVPKGEALLELAFESAAPGETEAVRLARAKEVIGAASSLQDSDIIQTLNWYLSTLPFRGNHLSTGTILARLGTNGKPEEWYICVSPGCDTTPRTETNPQTWAFALHPARPVTVLRLFEAKSGKELNRASQGRTVYLREGEKVRCLRALQGGGREPMVQTIFLHQPTCSENGEFIGYFVSLHNALPHCIPSKLRATWQLRSEYAGRLLQETGNHLSRIGFDYVNFGTPPKEDA